MPDSWAKAFTLQVAVLELVGRGTIIYFSLLVLMRLMPRLGGEMAMMDLVFLLLVAGAADHAMGEYTSIADVIIVIGTLMLWNYLLNYLSFYAKNRFPVLRCR